MGIDGIRWKDDNLLINFFTSPKQNERLLNAQKKNSDDVEEESNLHTVFYRAITDVETHWSSTYIAWERLTILKPYIDIVISSLNASKDPNSKGDAKRLMKINLTNDKWEIMRDLLEVLGPFAELTEKLEGTKYATMSYMYPGLLDNIKANLYKALEKYYEVIEKEALILSLLDPRQKKLKFADNDQKEIARTSLNEVYELAKNDANIQQESCGPKPKKGKYQRRVFIKRVYFWMMMNFMMLKLMTIKLKDI
ncbi:unnamed protein product [Rhizophagus irregularis]|nr:unnamed protein product [Rhizophagus irregularis]